MIRADSAPESPPLEWAPRWALLTGVGLSVLGLAVSCYLAVEHARHTVTLACPETGTINCLKVTTSSYSVLLGMPVAYLGVAYYVLVVALAVAALATAARWLAAARGTVALAGVAFVLYLLWAELFEVRAICLWCTAVHLITFALFAVVVIGDALRDVRERNER